MAAVVVYPLMKLSTALTLRNEAATIGVEGAIDKNPAIVNIFTPRSVPLIKCFPGSVKGFDEMRAASFRNATIEPVKVIPPEKRTT